MNTYRISIPLLLLLMLSACTKNLKKVVDKYEDGNIESEYYVKDDSIKEGKKINYYKSGNISGKLFYKNNELIDSVYYYYDTNNSNIKIIKYWNKDNTIFFKGLYENGNLYQVGLINKNNIQIGKWHFYHENGTLKYIKEFNLIKGKINVNQQWEFFANGDTINTGTSMKHHTSNTSIQLGDSIRFFFQSDVAVLSDKISDFTVEIPQDYEKENFTVDFSNYDQIDSVNNAPTQRMYSLKYDNRYPKEKAHIQDKKHRKTVIFYIKPTKPGKDTIRGVFVEHLNEDPNEHNLHKFALPPKSPEDTIVYTHNRNIYFNTPIEVKDTVK